MAYEEKKYADRSNEDLLKEYKMTKDVRLKQELVMRYLYMVKSIAIQMRDVYASFAQIDDIINEGVLAIMNSIEKFDLDRNVKFETYISKRIKGMVVDLARKQDWVPRSTRKMAKDMDKAVTELYNKLGRFPSAKETADYLEVSLERYQEMMGKTNLYNVLSLDMVMVENSDHKKSYQIPNANPDEQPEECCLEEEFRQLLAEQIRQLKENEQTVISLYYMEEMNMKDIAKILKVSEPRISQIHASAIQKLRIALGGFAEGAR